MSVSTARDPEITEDGTVVLFQTDGGGIYLHEVSTGRTKQFEIVPGDESNVSIDDLALSADGSTIAFDSGDTTIDACASFGSTTTFSMELDTGNIYWAGMPHLGCDIEARSTLMDVSRDGQVVVFTSTDYGIVEGDLNGGDDVFVWKRDGETTSRATVAEDGTERTGFGAWTRARVSDDGRSVAFATDAQLVDSDTDDRLDVYVRNMSTGALEFVTSAPELEFVTSAPEDESNYSDLEFSGDGSALVLEIGDERILLMRRNAETWSAPTDVGAALGIDPSAVAIRSGGISRSGDELLIVTRPRVYNPDDQFADDAFLFNPNDGTYALVNSRNGTRLPVYVYGAVLAGNGRSAVLQLVFSPEEETLDDGLVLFEMQ